tara:strand:+ start:256 stop:582 length:327 start_codon:yes stop_codon:yes gene_type:complete
MSKKVNYKKQSFRFKDVDITFDFNRIPTYDREYLKTMVIETINTKSIKNSGQSFDIYYDAADNFALFNNESKMLDWMSDFYASYDVVASHLLHGKKYYFAWTFYKEKE